MILEAQLHNLIKEQQSNICQIVACKSGEKVYSDCRNDYKPDDAVHIMSATKSIIALLIGIAIDKGQMKSIDDKAPRLFFTLQTYGRQRLWESLCCLVSATSLTAWCRWRRTRSC